MDAGSRPVSRNVGRTERRVRLLVLTTLCLGILLCSLLVAVGQMTGHPAQALDGQLVAPFRWYPLAVLGL
jgi:hypothetical protein